MTLFFFPHAGGSAKSYASFKRFLPKDLNVITMELSGRFTRSDGPMLHDIESCISELFDSNEKLSELLKEGDYAGLCLLESSYAFAAITRRDGELYVVMQNRVIDNGSFWGERKDNEPGTELACVKLSGSSVRLRAEALFENKADTGRFFYYDGEEKKALGPESKLVFKLDHFTGVRFGLFVFSTKQIGGSGTFSEFIYE